MAIDGPFQNQPSAIVTFDFKELATKTGIITLSGYVSEINTGFDQHLTSDETQYSSLIETTVVDSSGSGAPLTVTIDLDFDLPIFNKPITLNGVATVSFTVRQQSDGSNGMRTTAVVTIRKWDGSTPTDLVAVTSPQIPSNGANEDKELMVIPLTIPKTLFKKGEALRINILVTGVKGPGLNDGLSRHITLGHDPRNRDGTNIVPSTDDPDTITQIIFKVPFDIDL